MNNKILDVGFKVKEISDSGEFSGYGSVFGVKDSYGDIVMPGAFSKSLESRNPAMLWQHKHDEPIGVWTKVVEDDVGLYVEGKLLIEDDVLAKRAYGHMKAGSLSGLSIGYKLIDDEWDKNKEAFLLKQVELWEISPVTFPANEEARVAEVKRALQQLKEVPKPSLVERCLRDAGFSRQQAKAFMSQGYSGIDQREAERKAAEKLLLEQDEAMVAKLINTLNGV